MPMEMGCLIVVFIGREVKFLNIFNHYCYNYYYYYYYYYYYLLVSVVISLFLLLIPL